MFWTLCWRQGTHYHFDHSSDNHFMSKNNSWPKCFMSIHSLKKKVQNNDLYRLCLAFCHLSEGISAYFFHICQSFILKKGNQWHSLSWMYWADSSQKSSTSELLLGSYANPSQHHHSSTKIKTILLISETSFLYSLISHMQTCRSALTADCPLNFEVLSTIRENRWLRN